MHSFRNVLYVKCSSFHAYSMHVHVHASHVCIIHTCMYAIISLELSSVTCKTCIIINALTRAHTRARAHIHTYIYLYVHTHTRVLILSL